MAMAMVFCLTTKTATLNLVLDSVTTYFPDVFMRNILMMMMHIIEFCNFAHQMVLFSTLNHGILQQKLCDNSLTEGKSFISNLSSIETFSRRENKSFFPLRKQL